MFILLYLAFVDLLYSSSTQAVSQVRHRVLLTSDPSNVLHKMGSNPVSGMVFKQDITPNPAEIIPKIAHFFQQILLLIHPNQKRIIVTPVGDDSQVISPTCYPFFFPLKELERIRKCFIQATGEKD